MQDTYGIIDIIILLGISQGLFLAVTLQFISNTNKKANNILSTILVLAMIMLIGRFLYVRHLDYVIFQWSLVVDSIVFLFGPLVFLYIKRFLFKGEKNSFLSLYHFIPFASLLIISMYFVVKYSTEEYYQYFLDNNNFSILFNIISIAMIVLNSAYIISSIILIRKFKNSEKDIFSFNQSPLIFLYTFIITFSICILAWLLSYINSFFNSYFSFITYDIIWVAIPVFIYVIGYFSLKQPELFRMPFVEKPKEKKNRLSESEVNLLQEKLNSLMENDKAYLKSDLTLKDISEILNTSTNNISWLLNNVYNLTFYDFINQYRIKEFIQKVENKEHLQHTILALSFDAGFNSKSTFNKAFKIFMNDTPSNYIKKHRAA